MSSCLHLVLEFYDSSGRVASCVPVRLCRGVVRDEEMYGLNRVFVGRLTDEDVQHLPRLVNTYDALSKCDYVELGEYEAHFGVFVFREVHHWFAYTRVNDLLVAKRHVLLYYTRRERLAVIDAGPELRGTDTGTYVNGKRLKTGGYTEIRVAELPVEVTIGGTVRFVIYER